MNWLHTAYYKVTNYHLSSIRIICQIMLLFIIDMDYLFIVGLFIHLVHIFSFSVSDHFLAKHSLYDAQ